MCECFWVYLCARAYVSIRQPRQHTSAYIEDYYLCEYFWVCLCEASVRAFMWCVCACRRVSIRQHTSAYVSIRQHTPAYACRCKHCHTECSIWLILAKVAMPVGHVACNKLKPSRSLSCASIRQHTSAYVSIRTDKLHATNSSLPDP